MKDITVVDNNYDKANIGALFRKQRLGPESRLVEKFLEQIILKVPRGYRVTIFCEPRLESGYPDLVFVMWHYLTAKRWDPIRAKLVNEDLRVMHFIFCKGSATDYELQAIFSGRVAANLKRLEAAQMVRKTKNCWRSRALSKTFATRAILAIEAKMEKWNIALQQAWLNTWFASNSYLLLPHRPQKSNLLEKASSKGIGILTKDDNKLDLKSLSSEYHPHSYGSWLFNEWAWRAACLE